MCILNPKLVLRIYLAFFVRKSLKATKILEKKEPLWLNILNYHEDILKHVDGEKNINSLKHCVTRLRFDLKDESKADDNYLKNRDGVVTVVKA